MSLHTAGFARESLLLLDGLGGAVLNAGAAVDAGVLVDLVVGSALGNGLNGAVLGTGAAVDTVVRNNVNRMYLLW